jgi:hypothetical protein
LNGIAVKRIIVPECGGQVRVTEDVYLAGAAEWVGEVASSTESYDLHSKKRDYERAGVKEYLVVALEQKQVFWFVHRGGQFQQEQAAEDGILRSHVFPGLWLDPHALLELNAQRLLDVLQQGLATAEHAAFVQHLAEQRRAAGAE